MLYSTQSVGEKMTEEERATHRPGPDRRNRTDMAFSPRKPGRKPKAETDAKAETPILWPPDANS